VVDAAVVGAVVVSDGCVVVVVIVSIETVGLILQLDLQPVVGVGRMTVGTLKVSTYPAV
jgi:hypothetical protein